MRTGVASGGRVRELGPGLFRWTARHPAWRPGASPDSPSDWPEVVGSVACRAADTLVLVDPLVPEDDRSMLAWLDGQAECARRVVVLTTIRWHRRSRDLVVARYGSIADPPADILPVEIETIPIAGADETMVWLADHRALIPGDRLIGDADGGLRVCPESWLDYLESPMTEETLVTRLRPLLDLPVESVLVSHGEPVLSGGRRVIAEALGVTPR